MSRAAEPLDDTYFEWLCYPLEKRWDVSFDPRSLKIMYQTPFLYFVDNDRNRAMDGIRLREEFFYHHPRLSRGRGVKEWVELPCSVLEMLVALSNRASYISGVRSTDWLLIFLENLGVLDDSSRTKQALRILNSRSYSEDGSGGGLFPLRNPVEDQREVEIWYQMAAYIIENNSGEVF